jgi:hypothetical protein
MADELATIQDTLGIEGSPCLKIGDVVLWLIGFEGGPWEFGRRHSAVLERDIFSEFVVGELGRSFFTASQSDKEDDFEGQTYRYGVEAEYEHGDDDDADDDTDWDDSWAEDELGDEGDDAPEMFCESENLRGWIDGWTLRHEPPSFGRKLLVVIGRNPDHPFIETPMGTRLRTKLEPGFGLIARAQGADAAVIGLQMECDAETSFEILQRNLRPRLIEDFILFDIGRDYWTGKQTLSVFGSWMERGGRASGATGSSSKKGPLPTIVKVKRRRRAPPAPSRPDTDPREAKTNESPPGEGRITLRTVSNPTRRTPRFFRS